jgi:hypothetical protein
MSTATMSVVPSVEELARRRDLIARLLAITERLSDGHESAVGLAMNGARLRAMERTVAALSDDVMAAELDRRFARRRGPLAS